MSKGIPGIGYWCGLAACLSAVAYDVAQIAQVLGALRFPLDEILIYGTSLGIVLPLVLEFLALHHLSTGEKRFWTHASLAFIILYAVFVSANYVVQLATVIPAKMRGPIGALALLEQTPHSLFWDFDAAGYISMGIATLLAVPAVMPAGFGKWVRAALIAHSFATTLSCIVYFYPTYTSGLLLLGLPWALTAPLFMGSLAMLLRRVPPYAHRSP